MSRDRHHSYRILAVTSSYPAPSAPAASAFLADWSESLRRCGHEVNVLAPAPVTGGQRVVRSDGQTVEFLDYMWPRRWQTLAYGCGMFDNMRQRPLRTLQAVPLLARLAGAVRTRLSWADVVHAHWLVPAGLLAVTACGASGPPVVVSVHSTDFHLLRMLPGGRALARHIVRHTAGLHFVAPYLRRDFVQWLDAPTATLPAMSVAPMGYSDDLWPSPVKSKPTVGFLGRLVPIKGVDVLIRACAAYGIGQLQLAGAGPESARVAALARRLGVAAHFHGMLPERGRAAFLASCDVMVFPSLRLPSGRTEGTPVAVLEALRSGRVVVASDVGGISDVIDHGRNGFLVPPGDSDALGRCLAQVIDDWDRSREVAARAPLSVSHLSAARVAMVHTAMYDEVLGRAPNLEVPVVIGDVA